MKKACVIGGSYFLGSHVCDQLSNTDYKVALGKEFSNQHMVLTRQEPMREMDMTKMLAEI